MNTFTFLRRTILIFVALASTTAAVSLQFLPNDALSLTNAQTPLLLALLALLTLPAPTLAARLAARRAPQPQPTD